MYLIIVNVLLAFIIVILCKKNITALGKIQSMSEKTFFLDVDSTLSSFESSECNKAMVAYLKTIWATEVAESYFDFFNHAQLYHQGIETPQGRAFEADLRAYPVTNLTGRQQSFMYSRELYLKIIAKRNDIELSDTQVNKACEKYWKAFMESSRIYEDSIRFMKKIKNKFIAAGSDQRLMVKDGQLTYDPEHSKRLRMERTVAAGFLDYFPKSRIIIGDPNFKPSDEFWIECLRAAKLKKPEDAVLVDDSVRVIQSAADFGFQCYMIDRKGGPKLRHNNVTSISSFDEIKD